MPRPRTKKNKDLPDNLHPTSRGTYEYKHPITGKRHGMGSDRRKAIEAANILNQRLLPQRAADLIGKVMGGQTITEVIKRFRDEFLPERNYAARTLSEIEYRLRRYEKDLGNRSWATFGLEALSDWLRPLTRAAYIKHRGQWVDIYRFACSVGLSDRNLADLTLVKNADARRRKRWTIEQYSATRAAAAPWLQNAMDLALFSLQRREDLVTFKRRENFDNGRLLVAQHKTGKRLAIVASGSLLKAIDACKKLHPFCPYLVSHKPARDKRGKHDDDTDKKTHPYQVLPGYFSKAVAAARDAAAKAQPELFAGYERNELPTLHELRSLGAHLYEEAGFNKKYIQALLGHEKESTTQIYLDDHKEKWDEVAADLNIQLG